MARRSLRTFDWGLLATIVALTGVGMVLVYTASRVPAYPGKSVLFDRQLLWLGLGTVALGITAAVPFRVWEEYSHFFYGVGVLLLVAVLAVGVEREGARRWLGAGSFRFQPSEMAKLATILLVARLLARPRLDLKRLSTLVPIALLAGIPFVLILLEPDLGTSLSLPAAVIPMLYWAGFPLGTLAMVASPLVSVLLSWNLWVWLGFLGLLVLFLTGTRVRRSVTIVVLALNMVTGAGAPLLWNALHGY